MRVLVTGHHGYIGTLMTRALQEAGHVVVGLDTDYFRDCTILDPDSAIESIVKDIRDLEPADLDGFDAVIHLAALSNDPLGDLNPRWTFHINLDASLRLARLAKAAGVQRFLFSSSCSVYGAASAGDSIGTILAPVSQRSAARRRNSGCPNTTGRPCSCILSHAATIVSGPTPAGSPMVTAISGRSRVTVSFAIGG